MRDVSRIVVVGGSAAGPKAAAKARRINSHAEIVILQKDPDLSMASCGYPYYVSGVIDDRNLLLSTGTGVTRDPRYYREAKAIEARTNTEVTDISPARHVVSYRNLLTGETGTLNYDKLIIATGSIPRMPPVPGTDLRGVTTLQSMKDVDFLRRVRDERKAGKAVVVGGGLIGVETCEALRLAGIEVTIVELVPQLLAFLDWELAKLVENHVRSKGVNVITGSRVAGFLGDNGALTGVTLGDGTEILCELAVVAVGVEPNSELARRAGLEIGVTGGIAVNEYLQTSDPDIYAAGDCIETVNLITGKKVHAPYGDLANLQGRVAGRNAASENRAVFKGTIQTGICKVFDFSAGSTGLSERSAEKNGLVDSIPLITAGGDKPGYMNGQLLVTKLLADRTTGRILGAQCVGPGNVGKQIAQWAMAIQGGLSVEDLVNADLPYAPPFSPAIDHFITTAHVMQNKMENRFTGISSLAVKEKLDRGERPVLLDVRDLDEFKTTRLGIGETLIPLDDLREKAKELPEDKDKEIISYCAVSMRGYEAALALAALGWRNVKVMEGGIAAWPFSKEK